MRGRRGRVRAPPAGHAGRRARARDRPGGARRSSSRCARTATNCPTTSSTAPQLQRGRAGARRRHHRRLRGPPALARAPRLVHRRPRDAAARDGRRDRRGRRGLDFDRDERPGQRACARRRAITPPTPSCSPPARGRRRWRRCSASASRCRPGKGYSFFVKPSVIPQHSILLADVHVGCTPLGERDADRRDDGVQRPQHPARRAPHRRHHHRGAGLASSRGRRPRSSRSGRGCGRSPPTACRSSTGPRSPTPTSPPAMRCRASPWPRRPARRWREFMLSDQRRRTCSRRSASTGCRACAEGGTAVAEPLRVVIIGSGNIGSDLMAKVGRSPALELVGMAGIDPDSPGLARAAEAGVTTSSVGPRGPARPGPDDVDLAFDATSAYAHAEHAALLAERGILSVDLTPAALGPARDPGGQPRRPSRRPRRQPRHLRRAGDGPGGRRDRRVSPTCPTRRSSRRSPPRSAGPGTRANIDEFTRVHGARAGVRRRRRARQGDHAPQPGQPAGADAKRDLRRRPGRRPRGGDRGGGRAWSRTVAGYVPGYRLTAPPTIADDVDHGAARGRGRRRLPAVSTRATSTS